MDRLSSLFCCLLVAFVSLSTSCGKEDNDLGKYDPKETEDIVSDSLVLSLNLDIAQTTKAYNVIDIINNVNLFVYGVDGRLLYHQYYSPANAIKVVTTTGTKTIVAIANTGSKDFSQYTTLESLRNARHTEILGSNSSIVYAGEMTKTLTPNDKNVTISVSRMLSKLTFVFDKSNLDPNTSINISRIQLKNVPGSCYYIKPNTPLPADISVNGDFLEYNLEPLNHTSASPLYMFENMQGTIGTTTDPKAKSPGSKTNVCTYAEITANYSSPQKSGVIKYRIYLGENTTTSFDVKRETHYKETIVFNGTTISEPSWMVDIGGLDYVLYGITISAEPADGGEVYGSGLYAYGDFPFLLATSSENYTFTGWVPEISAVTGNQHYTAIFQYVDVPVTSVTIDPSTLSFSTLEAASALSCSYLPANATSGTSITYSSDNTSVAIVNSLTGVVTSKGWGACTVTATSSNGITSTCHVSVINPTIYVNSISVSIENASLDVGTTTTATAAVYPWNATDRSVSWSTSDASVATVGISGMVTAVGEGLCDIIASAQDGSGVTGSASITVTAPKIFVNGVTISENSIQMDPGENHSLSAIVYPVNASDRSVVWTSSDNSVASVSSNGLVTATGPGTATITVTTDDGGFTASCIVTVYTVIWVNTFIGSKSYWSGEWQSEMQREYIFYARLETDDMSIVQLVAPFVEITMNYQLRAMQNLTGTVQLYLNTLDNNENAWLRAEEGLHDMCAYIGILDRDSNDYGVPNMYVSESASVVDGSVIVNNYKIIWSNSRPWGYDRR